MDKARFLLKITTFLNETRGISFLYKALRKIITIIIPEMNLIIQQIVYRHHRIMKRLIIFLTLSYIFPFLQFISNQMNHNLMKNR